MLGNAPPLVNVRRALLDAGRRALRLVLPSVCLLCGAAGVEDLDLCPGCAADLPRNRDACPGCAQPDAHGLCPRCQDQPLPFARAFVPFRYRPPLDFLVRRLKFASQLGPVRPLGVLFTEALAMRGGPLPDGIVPVPLHPLRLRERGFNQALELASIAARRFDLPVWHDGLHRIRYTTAQARLDAARRVTNPLGAFAAGRSLAGQRLVLFDDVVTTASTAAECARVLRAAGAIDVELWAIARTAL